MFYQQLSYLEVIMPTPKKEDNNLCSEQMFQTFFSKNATLLRNFLYYKFGGMNDIDDVVQESFIKLWNNCHKVTPASAKSYLFRIAINHSTSIFRHESVKLKYQKNVEYYNKGISNESPEFLLEEKEFQEKLDLAIASLSSRQREVFLLNRIEKKTFKEIAELSGVSVKAIEKLMHKALLKLRTEIKNIP